jgi:hypothetical protein
VRYWIYPVCLHKPLNLLWSSTEHFLSDRGWKEEHAHWLSAILLRLPNLRELLLEGNPIGPEGARAIARAIRGYSKLEVLDLEGLYSYTSPL